LVEQRAVSKYLPSDAKWCFAPSVQFGELQAQPSGNDLVAQPDHLVVAGTVVFCVSQRMHCAVEGEGGRLHLACRIEKLRHQVPPSVEGDLCEPGGVADR